jgi:hypothetical protein
MDIWDWALAAYGRPGVPEAALALQDRHGQNTSFLLWAVWAETDDAERPPGPPRRRATGTGWRCRRCEPSAGR